MIRDLKKSFRKDPDMVWRKIDNKLILIPLHKAAADIDRFYILKNKSAIYIWQLIDGKKSVEQIKRAIVKRFQVKPKTAERDLLEFLTKLKKIKAVI